MQASNSLQFKDGHNLFYLSPSYNANVQRFVYQENYFENPYIQIGVYP